MNETLSACEPTLKDRFGWNIREIKHRIKSIFVNLALKVIRNASSDSGSKSHAEREFKAMGYTPLDQKQEEDPNKWIQENVMDLLSVFALQGHSGFSAPFCIKYFEKLANRKPLSPITCADEEWGNSFSRDDHFQNKRLSSVFKEGKEGKPYYINAIVWKGQNGSCFTGKVKDSNGDDISSSQNIKIPFTPKTFYIDVIETEWADQAETVEKEGGGWWTSVIKDESQLNEVFEHYTK